MSGYDVQFSANQAFTDEDEIIARTAEEISYRRDGLAEGTDAYLRVRSASGTSEERITSDWSTHVTGMTLAPVPEPVPEPPAVPVGLRISDRGEDFIEWSWDPVDGVNGYDVQFSTNEIFSDEDEVIARTVEEVSYRREDLEAETSAYLRVRSAAGAGEDRINSDWSIHLTGMTLAPEPEPVPPAVPTGLVVSDTTETSITWTWNAVDGAVGYVVQANMDEMFDATDTVMFNGVPFTTETSYTATDLEPETTLFLRVAAGAGTPAAPLVSAFTNHVTGMTDAAAPQALAAPANLREKETGSDYIEWEWDEVEGASGYHAQFSTDSGFSVSDDFFLQGMSNTDQRVSNLEPESAGYFRVRAYAGTTATDRVFGEWSGADKAATDEPPPPPPTTERTSFGAGTWLVGSDIEPGRYFTNPRDGCYWERLSGLGGTSADRIANEFIGFDSPQEIVDIAPSDRAFNTDEDCGTWDQTPEPPPPAGTIPPGTWLVGGQVAPGVYEVDAGDDCYWERLSGFSGRTSEDVLANDFVSGGGRQLVEIAASDVGFSNDEDCGTWRAIGSATVGLLGGATASETMEANRQLHEAHRDRHRH